MCRCNNAVITLCLKNKLFYNWNLCDVTYSNSRFPDVIIANNNFHIKLASMYANIKNPNFKYEVIPRRCVLSRTDGASKPIRESTTGNGIRENILAWPRSTSGWLIS